MEAKALGFKTDNLKVVDTVIVVIMGLIAACGLVYEYVLSHYAARVIGSVEIVIFSIISIMIVSMGVGAFLASKLKDPFISFSVLESLIAMTAIIGIFMISGGHSLAYDLPAIIANTYNVSYDMSVKGGVFNIIESVLSSTSFIIAAILGVMIGMEIPLMARIREIIHAKHLQHNAGMIYGADYIGAGLGAAAWIFFLIHMDISTSIAIISGTNVLAGFVFIFFFWKHIKKPLTLIAIQIVTMGIIWFGCVNIDKWQHYLEDSLYVDELVFSKNTTYQRIAITEGKHPYTNESIYSFFINGRTQFSQGDEMIYHNLLVAPVMEASYANDNVLIIGGGDGLALRDVLKYNPQKVTLLDLDDEIIQFFKDPYYYNGKQINEDLLKLNEYSFSDERVNLVLGDAFLNVQNLMREREKFDAIIVDLPDPSHPDLNKMYSTVFYKRLNYLLEDGGAISIQSTSPYHAKKAFQTVKKTMEASGFSSVEQYHHNVPSFGEWGWTIATKNSYPVSARLRDKDTLSIDYEWLNRDVLLGSFHFGSNFYEGYDKLEVNTLGSGVMYNHHQYAWKHSNAFAMLSDKSN
jgi:spermidine synthase